MFYVLKTKVGSNVYEAISWANEKGVPESSWKKKGQARSVQHKATTANTALGVVFHVAEIE